MNLTILIWLPLAAVIAGLVLPAAEARFAALLGSGATLVLAVVLLFRFDGGQQGLQFVTDKTWISQLGIHYKLGVDGLNLFLIVLAAILFFASIVWSALREWERPHLFYLWFGLAESGVLGALMAQDLALFVVFFDLMLV
ncbi:MAG TPA: NADH-quinone oxidoreductase subunit M, partial [Solirubrobacteraceae bacterium]